MPELCLWLRIGYWLYVNTRFGRWYYNQAIQNSERTYPLGHSAQITLDFDDFRVGIISFCKDNYGFVVWRRGTVKCIIVDPGYFPPFKEFMTTNGLKLDSILITHKHYDHCGSIEGIKILYPAVKIYSHELDKIRATTHFVSDKVSVLRHLCDNIKVTAYHTPGHTSGHLIYSINTLQNSLSQDTQLLLFTGDCIFLGSMGAMFEGNTQKNLNTLESFVLSMMQTRIPADKIHLFPGHEYSVNSLQFIVYNCTPYSSLARKKLSWCEEQRTWFLPTIPTTLFDELSYSPYLRIAISTVPEKERYYITKMENDKVKKYYMPNLLELMHETILSQNLLKSISKTNINFKKLKIQLFEDIFCQNKRVLLRCEHCAPQPFTTASPDIHIPDKCYSNSNVTKKMKNKY